MSFFYGGRLSLCLRFFGWPTVSFLKGRRFRSLILFERTVSIRTPEPALRER